MAWVTDKFPDETRPYQVSIALDKWGAMRYFSYVAFYDAEKKQWFKQDPFEKKFEPTEPLEGTVTGWDDNPLPVFMN